MRDLVITLAEKAAGETPAVGPDLRGLVDRVKSSASEFDELGDAGNLSGTQAEFAKLEEVLKQLRAITKGEVE